MLIGEAGRETGLTKKAIEYYVEQGLIAPGVLENGYRSFDDAALERLKRISVLRRLGVGIEEIRAVLGDETGSALKRLSVKRVLAARREQARQALLDDLGNGKPYAAAAGALAAMEDGLSIAERLMDAFPGYYGRFLCLHFARFLDTPVTTAAQRAAYEEIVAFLDGAPALAFPPEVQEYLDACTQGIGTAQMTDLLARTEESLEDIDGFLAKNEALLEEYYAFKRSEAYRRSPAGKLEAQLKAFCSSSGYYDRFLPALCALSPAYAAYRRRMEAADAKLLAIHPELAEPGAER